MIHHSRVCLAGLVMALCLMSAGTMSRPRRSRTPNRPPTATKPPRIRSSTPTSSPASRSFNSTWACCRTTPTCSSVAASAWWSTRAAISPRTWQSPQKEGATITGVWLTHSHADFVAGHVEFAKQLGVPISHQPRTPAPSYPTHAAQRGRRPDRRRCGRHLPRNARPHARQHVRLGRQRSNRPGEPLAMLTGDTLFIGSVGRPDLMGKGMSASTLASMMFDTWTKKLSKLPDDVMILPAHGAGSLCGAHLSDEPVSTLGQQRVSNAVSAAQESRRVHRGHSRRTARGAAVFRSQRGMNRRGPIRSIGRPKTLPLVKPSRELTDPAKYYVVDVRRRARLCRRPHSQLGQHRPARPVRDVDRHHGPLGCQNGARRQRIGTPRGAVPAAPRRLPARVRARSTPGSRPDLPLVDQRHDLAPGTVPPDADARFARRGRRAAPVGVDGACGSAPWSTCR